MADIEEHAERILQLVHEFETLENEAVRNRVFELLEHIDHLHRSCIWKVFELATQLGGKGLIDRMTQDTAVKTLFMLYDLIPVDPLAPVEAELRRPQTASGGFIPLRNILGRKPAWRVGFLRADLVPGTLRAVEIDRTPTLICAIDDEVFAFRNACGRSILPLHLGRLEGSVIVCPWHGCRYDARSGRRLDRSGANLEPLLVSIRDDKVFIATNVAAQQPVSIEHIEHR
jgi:nitrite reductase/ring-hydroxylating ferredoxin subunit